MPVSMSIASDYQPRRGPGRPKGSKNRPKEVPTYPRPRALETKPRAPNGSAALGEDVDPVAGRNYAERVMRAKAEMLELELAERRGEVIARKDLLPALQRSYARFRARMRSIPAQWAGQFAPPSKIEQAEAALRKAIDEALAELAGDARGG